jgi:hypothetical protein
MIYYSTEINFINENILKKFKKNILNNIMLDIGNGARYVHSQLNIHCLILFANSKESIYKIVSTIYNHLQNIIKTKTKDTDIKIFNEILYKFNINLNFGSKFLLDQIFPNIKLTYNLAKLTYKSHLINFSKANKSELSNEILFSSESIDGLCSYIFYIQTSINDILKNEPFPDNFYDTNLNLHFLFFKNKFLRLASCIPTVKELEWINNSFDNIFKYEIFRNAIENSKFLKINYTNKKVNYYILNPEDDLYDEEHEKINNILKDYIINYPKYDIKNLVINETVVNHISKKINFNVNALEWNSNQ